jgi:hypothetical protein
MPDVRDLILAAALVALIVTDFTVVAGRILSHIWSNGSFEIGNLCICCQLGKHCRSFLAELCRHKSVDPVNSFINERLEERAIKRLSLVFRCSWIFGPMVVAGVLRNIFLAHERVMTLQQDCGVFLLYSIIVIVKIFPRFLTRRSIDVLYAAIMGLIAFLTTPLSMKEDPDRYNMLIVFGVRSILGLALMKTRMVAVCNILYLCALTGSYAMAGDNPFKGILGELVATTCLVITVRSMEQCSEAELRKDAEARYWRMQHSAGDALLSGLCDAVVELDDELCIAGESPKLSALLFHGAGKSLRGAPFQDFMAYEEDQRLFQERTKREQGDNCLAQVLHLRMRDSLANTLKLEVFSVQFIDSDSKVRHLVGMRESTEKEAANLRHLRSERPELPNLEMLVTTKAGYSVVELGNEPGQVAAEVDTADPRLPIRRCTPTFQYIMGPACESPSMRGSGPSLLQHLGNRRAFEEWLQDVMNKLLHNDVVDNIHFRAVLLTGPATSSHAQITAQCSLELSDALDSEEDGILAWVVFQDLEKWIPNKASGSGISTSSTDGNNRQGCPSFCEVPVSELPEPTDIPIEASTHSDLPNGACSSETSDEVIDEIPKAPYRTLSI